MRSGAGLAGEGAGNNELIELSSCRRWGAGGATSEATTAFVKTAHAELGLETCMHLTCTNMPVAMVDLALKVRISLE